MKKLIHFVFAVFLSISIQAQEKIIYVIDYIPVINDPEEGDDINNSDIADLTVIKNKDSLKLLGYENMDAAIFIFTKEYRQRPDDLKQIPSTKKMERKSGTWYFQGKVYNGRFIDYYYSGRKQGEGVLQNGKLEGTRTVYYQNGKVFYERVYFNGIENGLEKQYYEDGSLQQKGEFKDGKEDGLWEMYFPNGQVKQRSILKNGEPEGETVVYYSTGRILAIEVTKNGKTIPDKRLEKIEQAMGKGHESNREGNYKNAIKNYSKALEIDSSYAKAYFARGTVKLNDFQFDEAIQDFDKALQFEPYFEKALSNRAFARIRKYQFGNSRKLSENNNITVLASKDNPSIPDNELSIICQDLKQAIFLGDKNNMTIEAVQEFCISKN